MKPIRRCVLCGRPRKSSKLGLCGGCCRDDALFFGRLAALDPDRAERVRGYAQRAGARLPLFAGRVRRGVAA